MDGLALLSTPQLSANPLITSPLKVTAIISAKQPVQPSRLLSWECLLPSPVALLQGTLTEKGEE